MPKIYSMKEFEDLTIDDMEDLLPNDFNPEVYCRQFGDVSYQRFYHMVSVTNEAMVRLTDGSRLKYKHTFLEYIPFGVSDLN